MIKGRTNPLEECFSSVVPYGTEGDGSGPLWFNLTTQLQGIPKSLKLIIPAPLLETIVSARLLRAPQHWWLLVFRCAVIFRACTLSFTNHELEHTTSKSLFLSHSLSLSISLVLSLDFCMILLHQLGPVFFDPIKTALPLPLLPFINPWPDTISIMYIVCIPPHPFYLI